MAGGCDVKALTVRGAPVKARHIERHQREVSKTHRAVVAPRRLSGVQRKRYSCSTGSEDDNAINTSNQHVVRRLRRSASPSIPGVLLLSKHRLIESMMVKIDYYFVTTTSIRVSATIHSR